MRRPKPEKTLFDYFHIEKLVREKTACPFYEEMLRFISLARNESKKSEFRPGMKHGVVIVSRRKDIEIPGHNGIGNGNASFRQIYISRFPGKTFHAEFDALSKIPCGDVVAILRLKPAIDIIRGANIYCFRETSDGILANARPCEKICWPALKKLGFKEAVYSIRINGKSFIARENF